MSILRTSLALAVGLAASTTVAEPPALTFPARFANHETIVAVGVVVVAGVTRRHVERATNDDVLVLDDAGTLHIEDADPDAPPIAATWRWKPGRVLAFRLTPESSSALKSALKSVFPFRVGVHVGRGRVRFARDGASYHGRQVILCAGTFRGAEVSVRETLRYSGIREEPGAKAAPSSAADAPVSVVRRAALLPGTDFTD